MNLGLKPARFRELYDISKGDAERYLRAFEL